MGSRQLYTKRRPSGGQAEAKRRPRRQSGDQAEAKEAKEAKPMLTDKLAGSATVTDVWMRELVEELQFGVSKMSLSRYWICRAFPTVSEDYYLFDKA